MTIPRRWMLSGILLLAALASCGITPHNRRLRAVFHAVSDTDRYVALKAEADAGDSQLAEIFAREGVPSQIDFSDLNPGGTMSAEVGLHYPDTRKLYVLRRGLNEDWQLIATQVASSLPRYRSNDTIEAYREYLAKYPDDPPRDIGAAKSRLGELEAERREADTKAAAIARLDAFLQRNGGENNVRGYEEYLKTADSSDPARAVALERLANLQFEPYRKQGTRAAYREFVNRYPDSSIARRLRAEYVLDDGAAQALADAIRAIEELRIAIGVGVNMQEYSRRLVDATIGAERGLATGGQWIPNGARSAIGRALERYRAASDVWNWKIQNVRDHSKSYEYGYHYFTTNSVVMSWLSYCPSALIRQGSSIVSGIFAPDAVMQCYWRDAAEDLNAAKRFAQGS